MVNIVVIGGGVCGFGCAVRIVEQYPRAKVTLLSKEFTPHTTGDGSAGLWGPYLCGSTPESKIKKWSHETHRFMYSLWRQGEGGVSLVPTLRVDRGGQHMAEPAWKDIVYGYQALNDKELKFWSRHYNMKLTSAFQFCTFTCEPTMLLPYLRARFERAGGRVRRACVTSLCDLRGYDVIVNCTGLGAAKLMNDGEMHPIRGQVIRVKAPWVFHCILDETDPGNYIIPNMESVVLGGTRQVDDFNTNPDPSDSKFIKDGCVSIMPALENAPKINEWVGLRPGRTSIRVERVTVTPVKSVPPTTPETPVKPVTSATPVTSLSPVTPVTSVAPVTSATPVTIVHNYGHGGCGVTLFWGCAGEVLELLNDVLANHKNHENYKSKL